MKIDVMEYEKKYSFELEPITQLCGQNIKKKTYILESLRRYFGTYKYKEELNKWRDNIKVDGQLMGRKFFTVLSISDISDVMVMITWSKQSLMTEYVKQLMQKYDWQIHLRKLHEEVEKMVHIINTDVNRLGNVGLTYTEAEVWGMVQKTEIASCDQMLLEDMENIELFNIFLNLLEEVLAVNPRKMLLLLENIDHWMTRKEYADVIKKMQNIVKKYNVYFILTTSLDGYVECDKELCSGISIFCDVDFQMPQFEKMADFVDNNYPCYKNISEHQMQNDLKNIIQKIGKQGSLHSIEEMVICKLINRTLMLEEKGICSISEPELAFLKSKNVLK